MFEIDVEVTRYCDQNCEFCSDKNPDKIPFDSYQKVDMYHLARYLISKASKYSLEDLNIILEGGEPTFHPDLLEFCQKISDYNKNTEHKIYLNLYTNFSAPIELYKSIHETGTKIFITFHRNVINIPDFLCKLRRLDFKPNLIFMLDDDLELYLHFFKDFNYTIEFIDNKKYKHELLKKFNLSKQYVSYLFNKKLDKEKTYHTIKSNNNLYIKEFNKYEFVENIQVIYDKD